jgi:hypothetical protein
LLLFDRIGRTANIGSAGRAGTRTLRPLRIQEGSTTMARTPKGELARAQRSRPMFTAK